MRDDSMTKLESSTANSVQVLGLVQDASGPSVGAVVGVLDPCVQGSKQCTKPPNTAVTHVMSIHYWSILWSRYFSNVIILSSPVLKILNKTFIKFSKNVH